MSGFDLHKIIYKGKKKVSQTDKNCGYACAAKFDKLKIRRKSGYFNIYLYTTTITTSVCPRPKIHGGGDAIEKPVNVYG